MAINTVTRDSLLVTTLEQQFVEAYQDHYMLNDKAHRTVHFKEVLDNCFHICEKLNTPMTPDRAMVFVAASYLHDLFAWSRVNHHDLSCMFVKTERLPLMIGWSRPAIDLVAEMCRTHRASYDGDFTSELTEIFNAADLGPPNLEADFKRAQEYYRNYNPEANETGVRHGAIEHMVEKFSRDGYAYRGELYKKAYGDDLEVYFKGIDKLAKELKAGNCERCNVTVMLGDEYANDEWDLLCEDCIDDCDNGNGDE